MTKRLTGPLVALLFAASLAALTPAQGAAALAGTKCTKVNTTKTVTGTRYKCVKVGKVLRWVKVTSPKPVTPTTPAKPSSPTPPPATPAANAPDPWSVSPEPLSTCRAPDLRTTKQVGGGIAYPISAETYGKQLPSTGTVKVVVIPIDFSDVPGAVAPSTLIDPIINTTNAWLTRFSNGKLTYEWQTAKSWIRAPKPSANYAWEHPGGSSTGNPYPPVTTFYSVATIGNALLAAAQDQFSYKGVQIVYFIYPPQVRDIWDPVTTYRDISTRDGSIAMQVDAVGQYLFHNKIPLWAWFMHENLHPHGLAGHAPADSFIGVMSNETGADQSLSSWETLILDWQVDNQFYCVSKDKLQPATVTLSPVTSDRSGTKAVMVRTSPSTVLVIESRTTDRWSSQPAAAVNLPATQNGVTIMRIDTTVDVHRRWSGTFAELVKNTVKHGGSLSTGRWMIMDPDTVFYPGESITVDGVRITVGKEAGFHTASIALA